MIASVFLRLALFEIYRMAPILEILATSIFYRNKFI